MGLCAYLCRQYGLDPNTAIIGHRDRYATQCPGDAFYTKLPQLRSEVTTAVGPTTLTVQSTPDSNLYDHGKNAPAPRHKFDHGRAAGKNER